MELSYIYKAIPDVIEDLKRDYIFGDSIIRNDIFNILEKHCVVVYYPLQDEKNCGFHTQRFVKDGLEDFVYINTAKTVSEQVFTAAHELGHVWSVVDKLKEKLSIEDTISADEEEQIINRFAAELLMPTEPFINSFHKHFREFYTDLDHFNLEALVKIIVLQMNDYMVPYEAVRRRLVETEVISAKSGKLLKDYEDSIVTLVNVFSRDLNTMLDRVTEKKTIPGFRDLLEQVEEKHLLDDYTIAKIKKDFEIHEITVSDELLNLIIEDRINGEK